MAALPTSSINLSGGLRSERQPSRTWNIVNDRICGETDGWAAVRQAVEIILNVERFRWQIYRPYSGMQWRGLIGQDPGYVTAELQCRLREDLTVDDRVKGISNFQYAVGGDVLTASVTADTVYGGVDASVEVNIA